MIRTDMITRMWVIIALASLAIALGAVVTALALAAGPGPTGLPVMPPHTGTGS